MAKVAVENRSCLMGGNFSSFCHGDLLCILILAIIVMSGCRPQGNFLVKSECNFVTTCFPNVEKVIRIDFELYDPTSNQDSYLQLSADDPERSLEFLRSIENTVRVETLVKLLVVGSIRVETQDSTCRIDVYTTGRASNDGVLLWGPDFGAEYFKLQDLTFGEFLKVVKGTATGDRPR